MRNYERYQLVLSLSFLFFVFVVLLGNYCISKYYKTYSVLNSVMNYEHQVELMVNDRDLKKLRENYYLYVDNYKKKFKIVETVKDVLTKERKAFHYISISIKLDKKYKINDSVRLVIYERKETLFSLIFCFLKED